MQMHMAHGGAHRHTIPGNTVPRRHDPMRIQRVGDHRQFAIAAPRPLVTLAISIDLNAVTVRVSQIERLAHPMVARAANRGSRLCQMAELHTERLARRHLGDTPLRRVGRAPKVLLVYRPAPGSDLRKRTIHLPPFEDEDGSLVPQRVELLGRGQQFVAFGTHPDTGDRYAWGEDGEGPSLLDVSPEETPEVDDAAEDTVPAR